MATQVPLQVSPLIKAARWTFLIAGFSYGAFRLKVLNRAERKRLDELERTRPEREAKLKAAELERQTREQEELIKSMGLEKL